MPLRPGDEVGDLRADHGGRRSGHRPHAGPGARGGDAADQDLLAQGDASDLPGLMCRMALYASRAAACDHVSLAMPDPAGRYLRVAAVADADGWRLPTGTPVQLGASARGQLEHGSTYARRDTYSSADPGDQPFRDHDLQAVVLVPLRPRSAPVPVAVFGWLRPRAFDEHEIALLEQLTHVLAPTLEALALAQRERSASTALWELGELRDELIRMISHDLATPIGVVSGFARLLQGEEGDADQRRRWLAAIVRNAAELETLSENLRDVTRFQGRQATLERRSFNLAVVAREVVEELTATVGGRRLHLDAEEVRAVGDEQATRRILQNLLGNATKFSPPDQPVEITVGAADDGARVRVRDHGSGIPLERQQELFQRFSRLELEEHRGLPGSGLGLYICKTLAEAQDGRVTVRSRRGQGSDFSLWLPAGPGVTGE